MGLPHLVGHLGCEDFGALVDKLLPEIPDGHRGTERPEDKRDGKEHHGHGEEKGENEEKRRDDEAQPLLLNEEIEGRDEYSDEVDHI